MRRVKRGKILRLDTTRNNLALSISVNFYYKNFSADRSNFGAYCNIDLQVKNLKNSSILCENRYQLSDIKFLIGFPSELEAYHDMLSSDKFRNTFIRFINGNFPINGEIVEIQEKNKKADEAKIVKINIGKADNVFSDYKLMITDEKNGSNTKTDLIVDEVFEEHSLCRVVGNGKKIVEDFAGGKIIKIKTIVKP